MVNLFNIIERVKKYLNIATNKEYADIIGISPPDFSKRKKTGTLLPLIIEWGVANKVNLHWLITGESEMIRKPEKFSDLLGFGFNKIRYLGRSVSEKFSDFKDGCLIFDGEKIPLIPENREEIEAAIDAMKETQKSQLENNKATLKAKDRVLEAKEKIINKQEKELHKITRELKARGFEPGEENFIRDMENLKTMLVGMELKMDARNMPPDMTPLMRAAYIETLGHFKRTIIAHYDEATNYYGIDDDEDWVPPHEREADSEMIRKPEKEKETGKEFGIAENSTYIYKEESTQTRLDDDPGIADLLESASFSRFLSLRPLKPQEKNGK